MLPGEIGGLVGFSHSRLAPSFLVVDRQRTNSPGRKCVCGKRIRLVSGTPISKPTAEISFSILMLGWQVRRRTDRTRLVAIFRCECAGFFHAAKEIARPVGSLVNADMVSGTFPAEARPAVPSGWSCLTGRLEQERRAERWSMSK